MGSLPATAWPSGFRRGSRRRLLFLRARATDMWFHPGCSVITPWLKCSNSWEGCPLPRWFCNRALARMQIAVISNPVSANCLACDAFIVWQMSKRATAYSVFPRVMGRSRRLAIRIPLSTCPSHRVRRGSPRVCCTRTTRSSRTRAPSPRIGISARRRGSTR